MDNLSFMLSFMWLLMAASGVFLYKAILIIQIYMDGRRRRKIYPSLVTADKSCKTHTWMNQKLAMSGIDPGKYLVCVDCGLVSGTKLMLNGPAKEVFHNNIKIAREKSVKYDELRTNRQKRQDEVMNQLVRAHIAQLTGDIHKDAEVLQQFFRKSCVEMEVVYNDLHEELKKIENG